MTEIDSVTARALPGLYVLNEAREPVPATSMEEWAEWMLDDDGRRVAVDEFTGHDGEPVRVSTVFLGMNHRHRGVGLPVLFETLVFGGLMADEMERYSTWAEAAEGHARTLRVVQEVERKGGEA